MKVLVVGSGGREHALAWKLAQEAEVFVTPGNAGIEREFETFSVKADDAIGLSNLAQRIGADFVLVGPEDPLIAGVADTLRAHGHATFGPGKEGAHLEGSKAWSKSLMAEAGVPTAAFQTFDDPMAAREYAAGRFAEGHQVAVKASGAALGKGVVVCSSIDEAEDAIARMMVERELGVAGETVVIEDRLVGREFSLLSVVSDGEFISLPVAQDYKRALDGDRGPNTGGMGTYSPVPWLASDLIARAERESVAPIVRALRERGVLYRGVLFTGLMVVGQVPYCLEYNVRFGDPETQSVVRRIGAGFSGLLHAASHGLPLESPEWVESPAITVMLASKGYPGAYEKGASLSIGELPEGVVAFHSGTAAREGELVTAGGRVLGLSASAPTAEEARERAYRAVEAVRCDNLRCRSDIGL